AGSTGHLSHDAATEGRSSGGRSTAPDGIMRSWRVATRVPNADLKTRRRFLVPGSPEELRRVFLEADGRYRSDGDWWVI
ncbi:MAG: hypothetical protein M3Q48_09060, partial [Actinomycetota bacterium]|nr:hypothetical protein [Actinomycetota bacterium]